MKKGILIISVVLSVIVIPLLGLGFSERFNDLVFTNIVSPFYPLSVKESAPSKYKIENKEYWEDPRGLFPIFAYNVPGKSNDIESTLKIIDEGGINIVINCGMSWPADAYKVKDAFHKLGETNLKWIVLLENECKDDYIFDNANDETNSDIKKYLNEFNDKYVYGWYLWDEPGRNRKPCTLFDMVPNDDNADINRMAKQIRSDSTFNKKIAYVNLFPSYWESTPDIKAYEKYIDAFVSSQEYKPQILCYDSYPWQKKDLGGFRKDYYSNLDVMRKKSIQYNIPFWILVLSSEHLNYKSPSIEEISMQVFSALAYGAKGIGYFLYSRGFEQFSYKSWILEDYVDNKNVADSLHGPLYVPVKKLNEEIQVLGKILLNLNCIKVIHSSDYPNDQYDISKSLLKVEDPNSLVTNIVNADKPGADPEILIGVLKGRELNDRGTYFFVVNKNVEKKTNINISLNNELEIFQINKVNGQKTFIKKGHIVNAFILPGSGELFYVD